MIVVDLSKINTTSEANLTRVR